MFAFFVLMTQILFASCFNWTSQTYTNATSGSISFHDPDNNIYWQCGGKTESGMLTSSCKGLDLSTEIVSIPVDSIEVREKIFFGGFVIDISPYLSKTQNVGIKVNNRICLLGLNDGASSETSWCCDPTAYYFACDRINLRSTVYEQCVISDNDVLIKIGGGYGNFRSNQIQTFHVPTESLVSNSYGALQMGVKNAGCVMLADGSIVIIGGNTPDNSYAREIQVCKPNEGCTILSIALPLGLRNTRCIASEYDNEIICFGGYIDGYSISDIIFIIDVEQQTIQHDFMPIKLVGMSIYVDEGKTCLIGGSTTDSDGFSSLSNEIFCTENIISSSASTSQLTF